jgi:hypothetical protein
MDNIVMKRSNSTKLERIETYKPESIFVCVIGQHPRELLQGLYWSYCFFAERWPSHIYVHSVNPTINKKEVRDFFDNNIKLFWQHIQRIPIQFGEELEYIKPKLTICFDRENSDSFYQEMLSHLNDNLYNISSSEKKLLSINKSDAEFHIPMINQLNAATAIIKNKCSSFVRLGQKTVEGKANEIDVYVDRYSIDFAYVNLANHYDNYARDFDYLMARCARNHDNISAVEVKPASSKKQPSKSLATIKSTLDFIDRYEFSCEDSKTVFGELMPERLRPSELLVEAIEESTFNSKQSTSQQARNHHNAAEIPQIILDLVSKSGTANKPAYQLLINDKAVLLSLKNTAYLCAWLASPNTHYITFNKQLGIEKVYQLYCLVTEQPEKAFNNTYRNVLNEQGCNAQINDIVAYFRQSEANKLSTIVGRTVATKLKAMPHSTTYNFLDDPELGGYLGGRTENNDKNEIKSSLLSQGITEQQIEWLIPKSIDNKNKVKDYFQHQEIHTKTKVANTDLGRFLKDQGATFTLYENILASKDKNTTDCNKSSNPKQPKLFVCALPSCNASILIE